ncbi:RNA polymerase II-associated protein 1 [Aplysia californica]|uniref:RNA polymerase II-associated protein 1 n=1 Tax=Aplysia californica TaxID=6500 RepID=A0ABM1AC36_APLCA|nr:RNA polymerase II-associated protein 1 [Aplysia californica]
MTTTPQHVAVVTSVLQWNFLLEEVRGTELDSLSVSVRLSRVMCTFLTGSQMFLEQPVRRYLAGLLRAFTCAKHLARLDFEASVPGLTSFYDLYQEVLEEYEAASFGDPVFGLYVLLPLQQRHGADLRRALWGERSKILRSLRVPLSELLIPVENFLCPDETDVELVGIYLRALVCGWVQAAWSPLMYLVAVHHLNRFLFLSVDDGARLPRQLMWAAVLGEGTGKMSDVIFYKRADLSWPRGMELYPHLPAGRQATYDRHRHK